MNMKNTAAVEKMESILASAKTETGAVIAVLMVAYEAGRYRRSESTWRKAPAQCSIYMGLLKNMCLGKDFKSAAMLADAWQAGYNDEHHRLTATATYRNTRWTRRDYECTNVVACVASVAPGAEWVECDESALDSLDHLYTQAGVKYYGYL